MYLRPGNGRSDGGPRVLVGPHLGDRGSASRSRAPRARGAHLPTRPFFPPDTRTGSPSFKPLMFLNTTVHRMALETIERRWSQNIEPVNTTKPTSTKAPTVTSRLYVNVHAYAPRLDQRHLEIALENCSIRGSWTRGSGPARPPRGSSPATGAPPGPPPGTSASCTPPRSSPPARRAAARSARRSTRRSRIDPRSARHQQILGLPRDGPPRMPHALLHPPDSSAGYFVATSGGRFTSRRHSSTRFLQKFASL